MKALDLYLNFDTRVPSHTASCPEDGIDVDLHQNLVIFHILQIFNDPLIMQAHAIEGH
jgi:hypothetical protein